MEIRESIFWNLVRILWQKKIIFIISILGTATLTFIITSLMPKTYKASLTFIVNEDEGGLNVSSLIDDIPLDIGGFKSTNVDKYLAFLNSRKIRDTLIDEFNLWEEYGVDYIEHLYKELNNNINVIDNYDGTVTIECFFKRSPEKAFQMVEKVYNELYKMSLELNQEKSKNYRQYLEKSLDETISKLRLLEDSLKAFQISNRIINFDTQAEYSFTALAGVESQYMQFKIEHDILSNSVNKDNPRLKELKKKIATIDSYKKTLYNDGEDYIIAFNKMPDYGLTYYRLYRDVSIQQTILKFLLPLVHNAKIEENKETVNIQIVDPPFIPQYKYKPKRLVYMIIMVMLIGFIELFYFTLIEAIKKNKKELHSWFSKS